MLEGMDTKQGAWVKPGQKGSKGFAPGSYGDYIYVRASPDDYAKTAQQKEIGAAARKCAKEGKDLKDIHSCIRDEF